MNINDIPTEGLLQACYDNYGVSDPIAVIFARQSELIAKYHPIESEVLRRPVPDLPFDLHDAVCQEALKARAWWFVEEIGEAFDALSEGNEVKFLEEMSDATHFLTELMILSGIQWDCVTTDDVPAGWTIEDAPGVLFSENLFLKIRAFAVIGELAMAMWQLRNKPWKRTQVLTDEWHYRMRLVTAYSGFISLLIVHFDMSLEDIALLYLRKSEVNRFRIRTHY